MPKIIVSTTIVAIWGFSETVFASSGGEAGSLFSLEMLFKTINFLILLYLLHRFAKKPLARMLSSSAANTKQTMENAKKELADTKQKLEEYKSKLANLEKELEERRKNAFAAIEAETKQLLKDAEEQVKKMEEQSQVRIEQDIQKVKSEIKTFLINESVKMAEETIAKELGTKEQKALLENYTKYIKETA